MIRKVKSKNGFTLVEILIVLVILILMAGFLFGTFNILLGDYVSMYQEAKIEQDVFNTLDQMSRDLKNASRSSVALLVPVPAGSTTYSALQFQADLNSDSTYETYVYYLYHPSDLTLDSTYLSAPANDKFYRLYRYQGGAEITLVGSYAGHPGILLGENIVPPVTYDSIFGSFFEKDGDLVKIRLRAYVEKESVIKEKLTAVTSVYPRNP